MGYAIPIIVVDGLCNIYYRPLNDESHTTNPAIKSTTKNLLPNYLVADIFCKQISTNWNVSPACILQIRGIFTAFLFCPLVCQCLFMGLGSPLESDTDAMKYARYEDIADLMSKRAYY